MSSVDVRAVQWVETGFNQGWRSPPPARECTAGTVVVTGDAKTLVRSRCGLFADTTAEAFSNLETDNLAYAGLS
jgi:hypothetical protein